MFLSVAQDKLLVCVVVQIVKLYKKQTLSANDFSGPIRSIMLLGKKSYVYLSCPKCFQMTMLKEKKSTKDACSFMLHQANDDNISFGIWMGIPLMSIQFLDIKNDLLLQPIRI